MIWVLIAINWSKDFFFIGFILKIIYFENYMFENFYFEIIK